MTDTAAKPTVTGIAKEETTLAVRYKQGGRTVYGMHLTPAQIVNMIPRPDPSAPNPGNRQIRENHARSFADYYLTHKDWVVPGIILRAPNVFKYKDGVLSYAKRHSLSINILDGQHRVLGFHIAASLIQAKIEKALDHRNRALRTEGRDSTLFSDAEKAVREARALEDRFDSEQVTVEIQVTDNTQEWRQMFFDIADNQLGITASVKSRFDTRKVVNRALIEVLDHPLLAGRTDLENDRVKRNGPNWATARHVADIIRAIQAGIDGRIGKVMESTLNDRQVASDAMRFFDLAMRAFPQLHAMSIGQVAPETLRTSGLLGSPAMLRAFAGAYHELRGEKRHWSEEDIEAYFSKLSDHLIGPAHPDSIWARVESKNVHGAYEKAFNEWAYAPNSRRQDIAAVAGAIVDWGVLGKEGAPWAWGSPAPIPEKPKTPEEVAAEEAAREEAEALAAEIDNDPTLGELLAAQLEEPAKKSAKKR